MVLGSLSVGIYWPEDGSITDRDKAFRAWLGVGIAMLLAGSFFTMRTAAFLQTAKHAQGTIIARTPNWGSCKLFVTVEFNDGGTRVQFLKCNHSSLFPFRLGQSVPVAYNPAHPDQAMINSFWTTYGIWGLFLPLGLVFCVGAFVIRGTGSYP